MVALRSTDLEGEMLEEVRGAVGLVGLGGLLPVTRDLRQPCILQVVAAFAPSYPRTLPHNHINRRSDACTVSHDLEDMVK